MGRSQTIGGTRMTVAIVYCRESQIHPGSSPAMHDNRFIVDRDLTVTVNQIRDSSSRNAGPQYLV